MKELKEVLVLGFDLLDGIQASAADGKWTPADALNFTAVMLHAPAAVAGAQLIPSEIKRATPEDWSALVAWAATEFDLQGDAEQKVEAALEVAGGLLRGWAKWPKAAA